MRAAPEVLSGMRVRNQTSRPAEVNAGLFARISAFMADRGAPREAKPRTPYEVVFESRYTRHRIQIDSPEANVDARGRKIVERPLVAQFSAGLFSIPRRIKPEQAEYMLRVLREHSAIKAKEIWEQTDLNEAILVRKVASVVDSMKKDPELHKTVLSFLEAEDYTDETTPEQAAAVEEAQEEIEESHAPAAKVAKKLKGARRR